MHENEAKLHGLNTPGKRLITIFILRTFNVNIITIFRLFGTLTNFIL